MFACLWVFEHIVVSILELHAENLMIVVLKPLSRIIWRALKANARYFATNQTEQDGKGRLARPAHMRLE